MDRFLARARADTPTLSWVSSLSLAVLFAVLFCNIRFNLFHTVSQERFANYQADSQALAEQKIFEIATSGKLDAARGFLVKSDVMEKLRLVETFPEKAPSDGVIYRSQFGLQGCVGSLFQWILRAPAPTTIHLLESLVAAGTAAVILLLLQVLQRRCGIFVTIVAAVPFIFNPILVLAGRNLYWILPLIMLPLVATWRLYEARGLQASTLWKAFPIVTGLVFLKCLCGYEYITCLCLAPAVALSAVWASENFRGTRDFFKHSAVLFGAACLGFLAAMIIHFSFEWWAVGDFHAAIESIRARAAEHISSSETLGSPVKYHHTLIGLILMIVKYLTFPGVFVGAEVSIGDGNYNVLSASFVGMFVVVLLFSLSRMRTLGDWRLAAGPLVVVTAGMLASVSWLVAARGHALAHFHLNSMAFLPLILSFPLSLFATEVNEKQNPVDRQDEATKV